MTDLDSIASDILSRREKLYKLDFHDVEEYCLSKREDTLALLLEMSEWIEKNIGLFYTDAVYQERGFSKWDGLICPMNRVCMYRGDASTRIWIDNGLHFWWNRATKRVVFISNSKSANMSQKDAGKYKSYNFFGEPDNEDEFKQGYERFFDPCHLPIDIFKRKLVEYDDYKKLKEDVDADWALALETKQCLIDAVKGICEDEQNYMDAAMRLKGHMDEKENA